ncbi:hypothetical protein FC15_GL000267 [Lapidilactobacillus concavus DSM 17758]|uniref:Uncharacterized protein n=1 Tax=Lapidilactobacillus concavus DSM 17758 TaxID=1423735 RepID=A0A0R1VT07_9LACO|nr:hypothetical protein FC15_GL000267 [Lapidilactobacillus concavus DSM 17758]
MLTNPDQSMTDEKDHEAQSHDLFCLCSILGSVLTTTNHARFKTNLQSSDDELKA